MRRILIAALVLVAMTYAGWITFAKTPGSASVTIDTDKAKSDTHKVVERGRELLDSAVEQGREALDHQSSASQESP